MSVINNSKTLLTRKLFSHARPLSKDSFVRIVEVGPRDGLQNEPKTVPSDVKISLIDRLSDTGLKTIEVTSFVSPKWVPQMGDNAAVFSGIKRKAGISYPVLIPNVKGLEAALKVEGIEEIAVFASASDGFSKKNVNCTAEEGVQRIKGVIDAAKNHNLRIRGYVSCVVGCPYDGPVHPSSVTKVSEALLEMGCYEISLGDTIGVGTKQTVHAMIKDLLSITTPDKLAIHCHDTYGQALVNICTALELGIRVVDSSVSGLGGCPYAKGATGNASTEDVVYMLNGMGMNNGIDLKKLVEAGNYISEALGKPTASRVNKALYQKYNL
ncbi:PREDICTED: hydroxymethylglutaryl-CoA lyase, mitochondrial [Nicrophorus vespilloides]|uniref:hydroxymethylglutaryl-CoA lyase n=1 Tax=Nicrophorus vespilloides TaxID=110193 RepID=A0ABM1N6B3_NICVS|nr:PREDICTED: hydroxymethylglutaryl-CoA lyase, mitochondrial [Nicrophorus vespilloides]